VPNLTVAADTSGIIKLPAIHADVFRKGVNIWTNELPYIYTGGDSSEITLLVAQKKTTVNLKAAVDNKWVILKAMFNDIEITPTDNIQVQGIVTKTLSVGQQPETTTVPLPVFDILAESIKKPEDHGLFAELEKGYGKKVKQAVYLQDKAKALAEFVTVTLDTTKHAYWHATIKADTVFIHETLDSVNARMPYKDVLSKVFGVGFFALDKYNYSITIDSVTHRPLLYVSGKYDNAIPVNIRFTSDYKVKGIAHVLRWSEKDKGVLELHFWREVDIERYYVKSDWWCPLEVTGTWTNIEDNKTPLNTSNCAAVSDTKVKNIHILF
jgi:hypothetical protein